MNSRKTYFEIASRIRIEKERESKKRFKKIKNYF